MAWEKLQPTGVSPPARCGHTATLIDAKIFVYGGTANEPTAPLDDVFALNISACRLAAAVVARLRTHARARARFLTDGGAGAQPFLADSIAWSKPRVVGITPPARSFHTANAFADTLLVFGGRNAKAEPLNDVWVFNSRACCFSFVFFFLLYCR